MYQKVVLKMHGLLNSEAVEYLRKGTISSTDRHFNSSGYIEVSLVSYKIILQKSRQLLARSFFHKYNCVHGEEFRHEPLDNLLMGHPFVIYPATVNRFLRFTISLLHALCYNLINW